MARDIRCKVWFDWDFNGSFTEETTNLVSANGDTRLTPPGESILNSSGMVDQCQIELRNVAGRYSALNSGGALYSYIQNGGIYHVPVYVETSINGGSSYQRVFTGVTKLPRETGRSVDGIPTVRFDCRGRDELVLQKRYSTGAQYTKVRFEDGYSEADIINAYLNAGGASPTSIDAGLISIPWSHMDDESILEECWEVASAGAGRVYALADGTIVYENAFHWLTSPHTTSQQTYTPADWKRFEAYYDDSELYDSVTVEYSARLPESVVTLWAPDEPVQVPAGDSVTLIANYAYPVFDSYSVSHAAHANGGQDITASVTITPTYSAQRAQLVIANAHATLAATIWPLQIAGRALVGGPTGEETRTSAAHGTNNAFFTNRGGRSLSVRGNYYIQGRAQAGMLAQMLLDRFEQPRLAYTLSGVPGNGARRPGDRVTINDSSVMSSGRDAMVVGLSWRYSGMQYSMDIEAVDAAGLFKGYGIGDPYFIIGTHTLNTAGVGGTGKVWY